VRGRGRVGKSLSDFIKEAFAVRGRVCKSLSDFIKEVTQ